MGSEVIWLPGDAGRLYRGVVGSQLWSSPFLSLPLQSEAIATEGIAHEAPGIPTAAQVACPFVVPR